MSSTLRGAPACDETFLPRGGNFPSLASSQPRSWHLERLAIVDVRQSSPHQMLHNRESTARQYALVDRGVALSRARPNCTYSTSVCTRGV